MSCQDHPRACGENLQGGILIETPEGSPPRMRGKLVCIGTEPKLEGITPAHAGKTKIVSTLGVPSQDHPRACGENPLRARQQSAPQGSPPRMRGKLTGLVRFSYVNRITPAHAGKTSARTPCRRCARDHPRACGENRVFLVYLDHIQGSPPRMRGKLAYISILFIKSRITPAHAGKTFFDGTGYDTE